MTTHSPGAIADSATPPRDCDRTVLLVEDEPSLAETIAYLLRSDGFQVALATTGPEGLQAGRATPGRHALRT